MVPGAVAVDDRIMPELRKIPLDSLTLALRVWPAASRNAVPAVLLPATGKTAADWDTIAAPLSAERTVYAVDLRGHGASDWPGDYAVELMARDVIGLLDVLDIGEFDLIGHSVGGFVACLVAAARPATVRRLVVEDIPFPHPRPAAPPARPAGDLPFDWRMVEQVRPELDSPDDALWSATVAAIAAPTLVIGGGPASPIPQPDVAELAARLRDARLTTINAGHLIHATRPADFLAAVTEFL
ncbi:hydrolase [Actinoplanes sp. NBRC 101535]|nr:hydrolase [Actinoplanes sp. NBRC 101535]